MKYIEFINQTLKTKLLSEKNIVLFGQNISAGSCISGFTRGLAVGKGGRIINTPNSESSLVGIGFGCMMNGANAVFFMKQQDFLLLGIDQLVNTSNIIRRAQPRASFTIFPVIVDSGYEGPQSALNNLNDFCSIARIPGYTMTNAADAAYLIDKHLVSPGFRILGISQKLYKTELMEPPTVDVAPDGSLFQYTDGEDATIVCFNLSFPYGWEMRRRMMEKDLNPSVFSVNASLPPDWGRILASVARTRRLIIIDDSKSVNAPWQNLLNAVYGQRAPEKLHVLQRSYDGYFCRPNHDQLDIDYDRVIADIALAVR